MPSEKMNDNIRERRKVISSDKIDSESSSISSMPKRLPFRRNISSFHCFITFLIVCCSILISTILLGRLPWSQHLHSTGYIDNFALKLGLQHRIYAIVFDAGSTGSRLLVFTFHRIRADGSLKLDKELFQEIKPGLSYYASNPVEAAESLRPLLEKAKKEIPPEDWSHTPLVLKATAGLRLLPDDQADSILQEVRKLFKTQPFKISDNSVSIMEGRDEGLFSWFTVNFLLDNLGSDNTVACLDLGGGSTQVTFINHHGSLQKFTPDHHIHQITIFNHPVQIYSHSYLGLGLMSARLAILQMSNNVSNPEQTQLVSPCIHSIIKKKWQYANKEYDIRGSKIPHFEVPNSIPAADQVPRFEACLKVANSIISEQVFSPGELQNKEIFAISYYYDRATENGLIDPFEGGEISLSKYFSAAKSACTNPNTEQPFSCLDLTYISAFLSQGLGLKPTKVIALKKKLDGHEISWALGAAFHVLANEDVKS